MAEQTMYQHLVFGAGLIGGYLGCALAAQNERVAMVARPRVVSKLAGGAKLTDYLGHEKQSPAPRFVTTDHGPAEFLWLTVKCTQVESTLSELCDFVSQDTVIFCCQNGRVADSGGISYSDCQSGGSLVLGMPENHA